MQAVGREEVAAALARVYARPEFAERRLPGPLQWLADGWDALTSWLGSLLLSFLSLEETAPVVFWVIALWFLGAVLLALVHLTYTAVFLVRGRERPGGARSTPVAAAPRERDAAYWESKAREAAAAGLVREATLALYQAVVLRLDERGAVRFRPGKTPGEYRREARRAPELHGRFDAFVRLFLPMAFGPRSPGRPSWESLRELAAELGARA